MVSKKDKRENDGGSGGYVDDKVMESDQGKCWRQWSIALLMGVVARVEHSGEDGGGGG